jgi:pimeloyl-ACP methyl ester carboxylesterase
MDQPEATVDWVVEWSWGEQAPAELKAAGRQRLLELPTEVLRDDYLACQAFDVRERIDQIQAPTLVIASTDDKMVKYKFPATLAERIPHARLVTLEGAGHMFPLERPQAVAKAVATWLAEQRWED